MDAAQPVTMPKWPAWLMLGFAAACAYPAMTTEAPAAAESVAAYSARGQEPGWTLRIAPDRIDYSGNYGETNISVATPYPLSTANGRRYQAGRLIIDVVNARCNDAMSGHGYADQITVTADGETYSGCGGERRSDWDI